MNTEQLNALIAEELKKLHEKVEESIHDKDHTSNSFYEFGKLNGKIEILQTLQFTLSLSSNDNK